MIEGIALSEGHPFCIVPHYEYRFELGAFPAGSYQVNLFIYDDNYPEPRRAVGSAQFVATTPFTIPVNSFPAGVAVILGVALLVVPTLRKRATHVAVFILLALPTGHGKAGDKKLFILLKDDPVALTPEDLVIPTEFTASPEYPASGFAKESPTGFAYLIPDRARPPLRHYLAANPDHPRARLERYVVVNYPDSANLPAAINALAAEYSVEYVHEPLLASTPSFDTSSGIANPPLQDWRNEVSADRAWSVEGGWASVAVLDNGIETAHAGFQPFSATGGYVGGNFIQALSADAGRVGINECELAGNCIQPNVDELEPIALLPGSPCDPDIDGSGTSVMAGHGTHVAGLVAANAIDGNRTSGTCKHCSLAIWRISRESCVGASLVPSPEFAPKNAALTRATDIGAQIINQSFGIGGVTDPDHCAKKPLNSECQALLYGVLRDVLLVGAVGNDRAPIEFPASDPSVVAAAGAASQALWDRGVDAQAGCTLGGSEPECGSNYTVDVANHRAQELVAPAKDVLSTFYRGATWNGKLGCADQADGTPDDGAGLCTGTSMAAPIIAGIAGVLRSINPLVRVGTPDEPLAAPGIRSVLRSSTLETGLGMAWDPRLGFGRVDAFNAASAMLGRVAGSRVRNRAIPLFALHSTEAGDHAALATPQMAVAIALHQVAQWTPRGNPVSGYPAFPLSNPPGWLVPTSSAFVVSTEFRTRSGQPKLVPLFLLDRQRPWPLGCTPGHPGCNWKHYDHLLVSRIPDLEKAHADGYRLLGRQGYIFQRCAPEPACVPAGAVRLYRQCKLADDDCAVFVESEKASFEASGYTAAYPAGSDVVMGYAFPNVDVDQDELIDGFERLIGTNPTLADSDGDGAFDGVEYPLAGVPISDPCSGSANACDPPPFFDGFE